MQKISELNFSLGRKKSRTRKYFSSFSSFILLKSILFPVFPENFFEKQAFFQFSSFSSKSGHPVNVAVPHSHHNG